MRPLSSVTPGKLRRRPPPTTECCSGRLVPQPKGKASGWIWPVGPECRQPTESLEPLHLSLFKDPQRVVNRESDASR